MIAFLNFNLEKISVEAQIFALPLAQIYLATALTTLIKYMEKLVAPYKNPWSGDVVGNIVNLSLPIMPVISVVTKAIVEILLLPEHDRKCRISDIAYDR